MNAVATATTLVTTPEITPVVLEIARPAGNHAEKVIGNAAVFEPETVGVTETKAAPLTVNNTDDVE